MLPVDVVEPGMLLDICHVLQPDISLLLDKFPKKILEVIDPIFVEVGLVMLDLIEKFAPVFGVERRQPVDELVDERTQAPPIHCFAVPFLLYHLRRQVFRGAAHGEGVIVCENVIFGEAEVCEFDVAVCADEYVLRFKTEL